MGLTCHRCGQAVDLAPLQFERQPSCGCPPRAGTRARMQELSRMADRVSRLILDPEVPAVDIAIARARLRERCEAWFPERMDLYDMVYESRFDRLWEQFRSQDA